jgi:CMP-N-acetylneuraminic acid synthetase
MNPTVIALLPMKGNSERVPNKNMKEFSGKPLYQATLDVLLECSVIDKVVVNTDSNRIKKDIEQNYDNKVIVIDRPKEICGDYVSMNKIIGHDINTQSADIFIQTHSTNPLLKKETLVEAIKKMISSTRTGHNDSVFSVTKTQKRFYNEDTTPMNHDPKMLVTQHLPPIFEENSCFYIFTKESFIMNENRIGSKPFMFEIDKIEATDIDDPEDFIIAEILYKELRLKKSK